MPKGTRTLAPLFVFARPSPCHGIDPMRRLAVLALLVLVLSDAPAIASTSPLHVAHHPPLASYWEGFQEHWGAMLKKQNGVILLVLAVGAASLFIITRGKWLKN